MKRFLIFLTAFLCAALTAADPEPFRWSADWNNGHPEIRVEIAEHCYLYAEATEIAAPGVSFAAPAAAQKPDPVNGGTTGAYLAGTHVWKSKTVCKEPLAITVSYQGCRESGAETMCFLPEEKLFQFGENTASSPAEKPAPALLDLPEFQIITSAEGMMDVPQFLAFLRQERAQTHSAENDWAHLSIWLILAAALLGGIGLNLTPCVLPMIPVNLAILGASGGSWKNGMARAAVYGAGMAASYGILGATVVLTGTRFGELNASAWFNFAVAGIFLVLSLAMFDRFSIDFSRWGGNWNPVKKSGKWIGSFLLGALAALLAGACVAPVLIAVILFAADLYAKGNIAGLLLPFVLGIGMALPWPLAGAGMAVLPKPGAWMNRIKICFGVIILAAAAWYGYLGFTLLPGAYDKDAEFARLRAALVQSKKENRPVFLDFHASWCKNCKEMERTVFPDPEVQKTLQQWIVVPFQAEQPSDPEVAALLDRFGFRGLPAFAIIQAK